MGEKTKKDSWFRKHPHLTFWSLVLMIPVTFGGLNYSGMCLAKLSWISDEEKIRNVVEKINARETVRVKENGVYIERKYVPYKSVEDFLARNPECCHVNAGVDLPPPSIYSKIKGINHSVILNYSLPYLGVQERLQIKKVNNAQKYMTNCGRIF